MTLGSDYIRKKVEEDFYPQGDEMRTQIGGRRRRGMLWRLTFLAATILAIIILMVLLITIINQSFGLVAEQVNIPESQLVTDYNKARVAFAPNVILSGEDDQQLAMGIAADPNGVGFFGYAFYKANADGLRPLTLNGVAPTAETVQSGDYPGRRPLFIYSSSDIMGAKPEVLAFMIYYLQHLDEVVPEVGYFADDAAALAAQEAALAAALGVEELPVIAPSDYSGTINIAGSSTVFPITQAMAERFIADGFDGQVNVESIGTGGGFTAFCEDESVDIVDASRPITTLEFEACRQKGHPPVQLQVGIDALVVAVSALNDFAQDLTAEQADTLFTTAATWNEVNPDWPALEVNRYVPSVESGTMDFFVQTALPEQTLADLPYDALVAIYATNVSIGRCRAVEREQRFYGEVLVCDNQEAWDAACSSDTPAPGCTAEPRSSASVQRLIEDEVIQPRILKSWYLLPSLTQRPAIVADVAENFPNAQLRFKSWLSWSFISSPQSSQPEIAGVRTAILGSLWVVAIAIALGFPLGVAAAVYLEEYADHEKWYNRFIQTNINNLAGVPSIIYGMLGLAVFVRALEPLTSGALFGIVEAGGTANGRTVLSAGLTLGLLGLPIIIIAAQEAVRAVPPSLREASMGIGATKWQTIWSHVLPNAMPGILTGTILTMSRVIGETAPLVVVGASTFITSDPTGPFSKFTTLPAQIFQWTTRPQDTFRNLSGAAIIVLLILLLMLNATAITLRNRFSKRFA